MNILGVGAWVHDSAAALIVDAELVGHIEEDRLSREKHTAAYPSLAVDWLLGQARLTSEEIDIVAYPFASHLFLRQAVVVTAELLRHPDRSQIQRTQGAWIVWQRTRQRIARLRQRFPSATVVAVPHHLAHACYARAYAPRLPCCVLTLDSIGEMTTGSLTTFCGAHPRVQALMRDPHSIGYAYGAVTEHLGWRRGDEEGTVMALAASGDPHRLRTLMTGGIQLDDQGVRLDPAVFRRRIMRAGAQRVGPRLASAVAPRRPDDPVSPAHADLAAALQQRTEEAMIHLVTHARTVADADVLCLTGGVAANCLAAGKIAASGLFAEVAVPPAPGDSGAAAGAALAAALRAGQPCGPLAHANLGPRPSQSTAQPSHELAEATAARLAEGGIVGVCVDRAEAGPRALGRRSILANPTMVDVHERLAKRVKQREPFRPFAPAILEEHCHDFVRATAASPFMSFAFPVTDRCRQVAPAVVHRNGTARVQSLGSDGSFLEAVLRSFHRRTGFPLLINTSLNVRGQPTACSADDAHAALRTCRLDALVLDDRLIEAA